MEYAHSHIKNLSLKSSQLCIWLIQKYKRFRVVSDSVLVSAFGISISCKHSPTCSEYTIQQIQKHGTIRGLFKGFRRILTCW